MTTLVVGLPERFTRAVNRILPDLAEQMQRVSDVGEWMQLGGSSYVHLVLVGGPSLAAVGASCRQLRAAERCRGSVLLAAVQADEADVERLLDSGADDFFDEAAGDAALDTRLRVAGRLVAQRAQSHTETNLPLEDQQQFFELCWDLLSIAGFDGYFKKVNRAWTRTLGWSSAELLGRPSIDFVHTDDREETLQSREQVRGGRVLTSFSNRYRCRDGGYRWLEWQAVPCTGHGLVYAAARDVTEANMAKKGMRELSESLATTLDSIGDGVIATDVNGLIKRINPVAERLTGWTHDEALTHPSAEVFAILDQDTGEAAASPVARALRRGEPIGLPKHTLLVRRDRSRIPVADSCAPIKTAEGVVTGAVLVFRDLTIEREAETAHVHYQQQLILTERMASVGTLAAGVAHEINNPLTYVTSNLELALEETRAIALAADGARVKELEQLLLGALEGNARVTKIVRELKTFSHVEAEHCSVIDLGPVLELSVNLAFNEIRHRARLIKQYGPLPLVEGDDARLGQVFINLLVNAAQSMPDGNTDANEVRIVTWTDTRGQAIVEIRDTGPGITPHVLSRIFDPFFTTKAVGKGTGLGLAICRTIVTGMRGEISVQSELGKGSIFRVTLPAAVAPLAPPVVPPASEAALVTHGRVLVVDDEPSVGLAIRRVLRDHEVTVVTTAQEALTRLEDGAEFDVILSDLMMPGMSGMDLYGMLVRENPRLAARMVFVTGGAFTPEAKTFLERMPNECLEKPFNLERLRALVSKLVSERRAESACDPGACGRSDDVRLAGSAS